MPLQIVPCSKGEGIAIGRGEIDGGGHGRLIPVPRTGIVAVSPLKIFSCSDLKPIQKPGTAAGLSAILANRITEHFFNIIADWLVDRIRRALPMNNKDAVIVMRG